MSSVDTERGSVFKVICMLFDVVVCINIVDCDCVLAGVNSFVHDVVSYYRYRTCL